jgi:hypothetical protein
MKKFIQDKTQVMSAAIQSFLSCVIQVGIELQIPSSVLLKFLAAYNYYYHHQGHPMIRLCRVRREVEV